MEPQSAVVQIFSKGKVTIPLQIRKVMNLKDGDMVKITITRILQEGDII